MRASASLPIRVYPMHHRVIIVCIIVLSGANSPGLVRAQDDIALIERLRAEKPAVARQGEPVLRQWRSDWIARLEAVQSGGERLSVPLEFELGALYLEAGRYQQAEGVFASLLIAPDLNPSARIDAGLMASRAAAARLAPIGDLEGYFLEMLTLADLHSVETGEESTLLWQRRQELPHLYGDILYGMAMTLRGGVATPSGLDVNPSSPPMTGAGAGALLDRIDEVDAAVNAAYRQVIAAYKEGVLFSRGDPAAVVGDILYRMASLNSDRADRFSAAGRLEQALEIRRENIADIRFALEAPGLRSMPELAASLLLRELYLVDPFGEFIGEAGRLLHEMHPSHAILTFLVSAATNASNRDDQLGLSSRIFELVASAERRWFPDDHRSHFNWQWSIARAATNALRMGDVDSARRLLAELDGAPLAGQLVQQEVAHARRVLEEMVQAGHERQPSDAGAHASKPSRDHDERPSIDVGALPVNSGTPAPLVATDAVDAAGPVDADSSWRTATALGSAAVIATVILFVVMRLRRT